MKISTSILNSNDRLESVKQLNRTETSYIHIDVMDGKFVKDTQFNKFNEINAINYMTKYPLDIHLMVENPIEYIEQYNDMNIEYITFHIEVEKDINKIISKIKEKGYKVGISIKPNTSIDKLLDYLKDIDLILIMSVEPGKGGQEFIPETTNKIKKIKEIIQNNNYDLQIEVDGGINDKTIPLLESADIAVVGSYIINSDNYYQTIETLLKFCKNKLGKTSNNKETNSQSKILYKILLALGILSLIIIIIFGLNII